MEIIKNYFVSLAVFIVTILILLVIVSLVFAYTKIDDRFISSGVFLSMAISAFSSSFVLCRKTKKNGILHGAIINCISVSVIWIISCVLNGQIVVTNTLGIYVAICILSGIVGGILGVNV